MKAIILITVIIMGLLVFSGINHELKKHHFAILLWRWFTGMPHHGRGHGTDSRWFRRATKETAHVHSWYHMARIHRTWHRTGATVFVFGMAFALLKFRERAILGIEAGAAAGVIAAAVWAIIRLRKWHTDKITVNPLAEALAPVLAIPVIQAQKNISLPPSYLTTREGEIGAITLPPHFRATPGERDAVQHLIATRLPVDVDFRWQTKRQPLSVRIFASPKPPDCVLFADWVDAMEACIPGQIFLGLDRKHEPFYGSFNIDDPHWLASVGSGRGKSTWLMCTAAQVLHNDILATLDGIDPKGNSLTPLVGIPGVNIARDPLNVPQMWERIITVESEMMKRLDILKTDPTAEFPIKLLFIDEGNTFAGQSKQYWTGPESDRKKSDPATPSIWGNLARILWMGRAANVHVVFVGQRVDDRSTGGFGLRDSMGFRAISGFRPAAYKMLIGDGVAPKSQKPKGRWLYSDGQNETWIQNVIADPKDLARNEAIIRDYAMAGRVPSGGPVAVPSPRPAGGPQGSKRAARGAAAQL